MLGVHGLLEVGGLKVAGKGSERTYGPRSTGSLQPLPAALKSTAENESLIRNVRNDAHNEKSLLTLMN